MATREEVDFLKGFSSEEGSVKSDKDGEYLPEHKTHRNTHETFVDSDMKLKYLMDQIDTLTHTLNSHSQLRSNVGQ